MKNEKHTHTKIPWQIQVTGGDREHISGAEYGMWIMVDGHDYEKRKTDAAFIVRAVNNHDNLVNLIQRLLDNAEIDALNEPELEPLCEQARAALKAAKGED